MKSQPISISRYSNGTLVKLSVSNSAFVSYDFDPEKNTGTYTPTSITITPTFSGGVKFGSWRYSTDGATFQNIVSGQHGFTINGGAVILAATSDLYATTNSAVIVACVGDDPTYFDTVTIMRYVDPTFVYKKTSTAIKQTNDKISLIATEEQLAKYGSKFTVLDDLQAQIDVIPSKISLAVKEEHGIITGEMNTALAEYATLETMESRLTMTAQDITSTVSATYQTIADAEDDLDEAKSYADDKATQLESKITQTANSITSTVSQNYQSKTDAASDLNNAKTYTDNKDAALKTEIKQTTDSISSTVSQKVGKDEIISSINQSADRISLTAGRLVITSGNFRLDEYGNITATGANLSGTLTAGTDTGKKIVIANGVLTGYSAGVEQASLNIADGQFNIIGKLALNGNVGVSGSGSYVKNIEYMTLNIPKLNPTSATANFVKDFTLSVSGGVLTADNYLNTNTSLTTTTLTYKNSYGTTSYQTVVTGWNKVWSKPSISAVSVSHTNTTGTAVTSTGLQQTYTQYKVPTNITLGTIVSKYGIISSMG